MIATTTTTKVTIKAITMNQQPKSSSSREALLKSYNKRLKDDIKSILENFGEIVKSSKVLLD